MNIRHLIVQLGVSVTILVGVNVVVQRFARTSNPRQLLRLADQAEPATDLFFGNSIVEAGIDETAFAAVNPSRKPLNLGLGATTAVEHFVIFSKQSKHAGASVYYGFMDTNLTDPPLGGWDSLVGNRAMAYYVDLETALRFYAADSPVRALFMRLVAHVPMLVERYTIWGKVERLRRTLGEIGMPRQETNRFGRAGDFTQLESNEADFVTRCRAATADQTPLSPPVEELFRQPKQSGRELRVIEMPMPTQHRKRYYSSPEWIAYRAHLLKLVNDAGGTYVPASDWIADNGFADNVHLNAAGAREFSNRLANWVRQRQ